jgi:hypothetical protein
VLRDKLAGDVIYQDAAGARRQVTSGYGLEPGDAAFLRFRSHLSHWLATSGLDPVARPAALSCVV